METPYLKIRNFIGILGCLLPVLCIAGASLSPNTVHPDWWTSISITYYSSPVLIAVLSSVGFLLINYRGHDWTDNLVNTVAGLAALGVVSFPCDVTWFEGDPEVGLFWLPMSVSKWVHYVSASLLFLMLAVNSIWLFSKSENQTKNKIYWICGYVILADLVIFALNAFWWNIEWTIIVNESIMLLAFGVSWVVKGHMLDELFGW